MQEQKMGMLINGTKNDLTVALDDLFNILEILNDDIAKLKNDNVKES